MKTVNIDGLTLTDKMIAELKEWYNGHPGESTPEVCTMELNSIKNTFIKIMCDENNDRYLNEIKECLRFILVAQDSLSSLVPQSN